MLKKLSLVALVAMGSMSFASASTDLSDAIKGVTIGGYLRYRYTEDNYKYDQDTTTNKKAHNDNATNNEYKAVLKVGIKASDTVSVHGTMVYKDSFDSTQSAENSKETAKPFNVTEAYVNYVNAGVNVKAGMMNLATPLSDHDDDRGNGLLATYSQAGITGAFGYFNEISSATGYALNNNLAVLALIADIKPVKAEAWFYDLSDAQDNDKSGYKAYFLQLSANVGPAAVIAQYAAKNPNLDEKDNGDENSNKTKTQSQWGIAATANVDIAKVTAAYLHFGKNGNNVAVGTKNADKLLAAGDILTDTVQQNTTVEALGGEAAGDDNPLLAKGGALALVASAKVGAFTPGVQFVHATTKPNGDKFTINEYDADLAYQYNKKLKISGYYAVMKVNSPSSADNAGLLNTQNQGRIEVKYSF